MKLGGGGEGGGEGEWSSPPMKGGGGRKSFWSAIFIHFDQSLIIILENFEGLVLLSPSEMRQELYEFMVSGNCK